MLDSAVATTGGSVILSDASLIPDEFIDITNEDASEVSGMLEIVDRVEKSGKLTGASDVDRFNGIVGNRDIPSVESAKPESVISSDGKKSPKVGRLDFRDNDS